MEESNNDRFSERTKNFQKTPDEDESSKRRYNLSVKLRRKKRTLDSAKKRACKTGTIQASGLDGQEILVINEIPTQLVELRPELASTEISDIEKLKILKEIAEGNPPINILSIILATFRSMLAIEQAAPIGIFSNLGIGDLLVRCLGIEYGDIIQKEAAWIICNLLSGPHDYVEMLLKKDLVNHLANAIVFSANEVKEHCIWALSNIAGDCMQYQISLVNYGLVDLLISVITNVPNASLDLKNIVSHCLCILSGCSNYITCDDTQKIIQCVSLLIDIDNDEIHANCLRTLGHISKKENAKVQQVIDSGLFTYVIKGLEYNRNVIVEPCIRIVGNISSGSPAQTQWLLEKDILSVLMNILDNEDIKILKDIFWTISNIAAGTPLQSEILVNHEIFPKVTESLIYPNSIIRKEGSFIIKNLFSLGKNEVKLKMIQMNIIPLITVALKEIDAEMVMNLLQACDSILRLGLNGDEDTSAFVYLFESSGCLNQLEILQNHINEEVSKCAACIVDTYFGAAPNSDLQINYNSEAFQFSQFIN
ncbi:unnamed protein product [Blepharisma stoltei]|uniref:Importin subunit alpha n=1 Tax=Blepharisma stoltei TaxID=1481888 RepID=A0AAU9IQF4_9CILI|nr:unnamed protein product [Blepharisma stoltei]